MDTLKYTFNIGFEEPLQNPPYQDLLFEETSFSLDDEPAITYHTDAFMIFNQERIEQQLGRNSAEEALKMLTGLQSNTISEDNLSKDVNPFDVVKSRHAQSPSELRKYALSLAQITENVDKAKHSYNESQNRQKEFNKIRDEYRKKFEQHNL